MAFAESIEALKIQLETIEAQLERLIMSIEGDGNGNLGLRTRVVLIERSLKHWMGAAVFIGSVFGGVVAKAADLLFQEKPPSEVKHVQRP